MRTTWEMESGTNAKPLPLSTLKVPMGEKCHITTENLGDSICTLRKTTIITVMLLYHPMRGTFYDRTKPLADDRTRRQDRAIVEGLSRLELAKIDDEDAPKEGRGSLRGWAKANGYEIETERPRLIITLRGHGHKIVLAPGGYEMTVDKTKKVKLDYSLLLHDDAFYLPGSLVKAIQAATQ